MIVFLALSGILAFVVMVTLLLAGVEARWVFAPGFAVQSFFEALGFDVPNRVGVISTGLLFWVAIAVAWLVVGRVVRRAA